MRGSWLVATMAAASAAWATFGAPLPTMGAASASAPPTSGPAQPQPANTDSVAPDGSSAAASADDDLSEEAAEVFEMESEFARCMRDHGVDGYPDPQVNEDGIIVVGVPFGDSGDTEMDAAREACQHIFQQSGPPDEAGAAAGWEKVVPGGDCQCADGSEFAFWERPGDPTKVVFYLGGGGACWDATSCAFTMDDSTTYDWNIAGKDPADEGGIFDAANPAQPIRRLHVRLRALLHRRRTPRRRHP